MGVPGAAVAPPAIRLRGVRKQYGTRVAVDSLDLEVPRGGVFGLLGPNGAGKTSVIKMVLGLVYPTAGEIELLGRPPSDASVRTRVGFLPEQFRFHEWLTAREFLDFHGQLYRIPDRVRRERIPVLLERVGLGQRIESQLRTFSKGMLQRAGLAQALLNQPELLILDEPTSGLDPVGRMEVRDLLLELRASGLTVVLNSHILGEVERVCDQVAILDLGRLVWQGRPGRADADRLHVLAEVSHVPSALLPRLEQLVSQVEAGEGVLRFVAPDRAAVSRAAAAILAAGAQLYRLEPRQTSLEELFVSLVKGRDA